MKELANTKATVRLRKVEDRKEWYLYIESYPVFVKGKSTPQRVREYINRTVTTVEWDKTDIIRIRQIAYNIRRNSHKKMKTVKMIELALLEKTSLFT